MIRLLPLPLLAVALAGCSAPPERVPPTEVAPTLAPVEDQVEPASQPAPPVEVAPDFGWVIPGDVVVDQVVHVHATSLLVREAPSADARVLGRFHIGDAPAVLVVGGGGWLRVSTPRHEIDGWVYAGGDHLGVAEPVADDYRRLAVWLRDRPDADAATLWDAHRYATRAHALDEAQQDAALASQCAVRWLRAWLDTFGLRVDGWKTRRRVRAGDTLSGITSAVYGAEALLPALADVNRARIGPNPSHLPAGVVLQLPEPAVLVEALAEHHNRTFGDFPGWSVPAATVLATAGESP